MRPDRPFYLPEDLPGNVADCGAECICRLPRIEIEDPLEVLRFEEGIRIICAPDRGCVGDAGDRRISEDRPYAVFIIT